MRVWKYLECFMGFGVMMFCDYNTYRIIAEKSCLCPTKSVQFEGCCSPTGHQMCPSPVAVRNYLRFSEVAAPFAGAGRRKEPPGAGVTKRLRTVRRGVTMVGVPGFI